MTNLGVRQGILKLCLFRSTLPQFNNGMFSKNHNTLVVSSDLVEKRNYLFAKEKQKQLEEVGRIEKITVEVTGPPEDIVLIMNRNISTPYDCCKHISEPFCTQAALALVNDSILWDMHRPLPGNCSLKFLQFKDKDPYSLNKAFWRTGSFVLGAVISKAFKDNVSVMLYSFPPPFVKSGSFIYDVKMDLTDWKPTKDELRILSIEFLNFVRQNHKIERLNVKKSFALEIFEGNPHKQKQIPQIALSNEDKLVGLYKVGDHIDISNGPMIADTSFFGRASVTAVHNINTHLGLFYRFQGVALPKGILLNSFAYGILEERASVMNEAIVPGEEYHPDTGIYKQSKQDYSDNPMQAESILNFSK